MIHLKAKGRAGSHQALLTAFAMSMATNQSFRFTTKADRAFCSDAFKLLVRLCNARSNPGWSAKIPLVLEPGFIDPSVRYTGSTSSMVSVLQSILLPCSLLTAPTVFELEGVTDDRSGTSWDALTDILLPYLRPFVQVELELVARGFETTRGRVTLAINPTWASRPLSLGKRGSLRKIAGRSVSSGSFRVSVTQLVLNPGLVWV